MTDQFSGQGFKDSKSYKEHVRDKHTKILTIEVGSVIVCRDVQSISRRSRSKRSVTWALVFLLTLSLNQLRGWHVGVSYMQVMDSRCFERWGKNRLAKLERDT